jgi:hypothetical protein
MATPYPVGKPVSPPPGAVRTRRPARALCQPTSAPSAVASRFSVNWWIIGVATGLAVLAVVGLALLCAAPRTAAPPVEVAAIPLRTETLSEPAPVAPIVSAVLPVELPPPAPAVPAPWHFKRRDRLSADELSRQLLVRPELDLDVAPNTYSLRLLNLAREEKPVFTHPAFEQFVKRADLHGLPVAMGADCYLAEETAENLQILSRKLRFHLALSERRRGLNPHQPDADMLREHLLESRDEEAIRAALTRAASSAAQVVRINALRDWRQELAVPTLVQVLQAEDPPIRLLLVEVLGRIQGPAASAALVQRALFDLSAEVREAAVRELRDRPRDEYRKRLLAGLRYPWAAAADHAAEALVALNDRAAVSQLTALLDEPDPAGPLPHSYRSLDRAAVWTAAATAPLSPTVVALEERQGSERRTRLMDDPSGTRREVKPSTQEIYAVREVVRVNHLRNCLLCHAPSLSINDPVRGLVPAPSESLPRPSSNLYYGGLEWQSGTFVRADVTYLRQDFSVPQPVAEPGNWPAYQRYDYVVRTRYPTEQELLRLKPATYPQREAVRWALCELGSVRGE